MGENQRGREQIQKEIELNEKEIKKIKKEQIRYTIMQIIFLTFVGYLAIHNILIKNFVFFFVNLTSMSLMTYAFMNCIRNRARLQMSLESFKKILNGDLKMLDITENIEN